MKWFKENWFKVGILVALFVIGAGLFLHYGDSSLLKHFSKSSTELQKTDNNNIGEQNLISELEASSTPTTTPEHASTSTPVSEKPKDIASTIKATTPAPPIEVNQPLQTAENFNQKSITSAKGVLAQLQAYEAGLNKAIQDVDERTAVVKNLLSLENQNVYTDTESNLYKIHALFINAFNSDLSTMAQYRDKFSYGKGYAYDNYPALNTLITTYPSLFISKEQSISDIQAHNKILSEIAILNPKANELIDAYNKYAQAQNNTYEQAFEMVVAYLKQIAGSSNAVSSNYIPPTVYIPQIQLPKITNCYVQGYGSSASINCLSY